MDKMSFYIQVCPVYNFGKFASFFIAHYLEHFYKPIGFQLKVAVLIFQMFDVNPVRNVSSTIWAFSETEKNNMVVSFKKLNMIHKQSYQVFLIRI